VPTWPWRGIPGGGFQIFQNGRLARTDQGANRSIQPERGVDGECSGNQEDQDGHRRGELAPPSRSPQVNDGHSNSGKGRSEPEIDHMTQGDANDMEQPSED
jgi:hypothetical protein